jgi:hypothetical protein
MVDVENGAAAWVRKGVKAALTSDGFADVRREEVVRRVTARGAARARDLMESMVVDVYVCYACTEYIVIYCGILWWELSVL